MGKVMPLRNAPNKCLSNPVPETVEVPWKIPVKKCPFLKG